VIPRDTCLLALAPVHPQGDDKASAGTTTSLGRLDLSEVRFQAHRRGNSSPHRRTTTRPVLQTLILSRVMAEYQPGKLATTDTRQLLIRGSVRMTLALDARGPERATAFVPTSTATAVAETARPFITVSVVAEGRCCGRAAKEPLGACGGIRTARPWEPRLAAELGRSRTNWEPTCSGQRRAGWIRQVRPARHEKVLAGELERSRPVGMVQPQSRPQPATAPRWTIASPPTQ
jgi:hypothetical protein